jgi:hypothetical protein
LPRTDAQEKAEAVPNFKKPHFWRIVKNFRDIAFKPNILAGP